MNEEKAFQTVSHALAMFEITCQMFEVAFFDAYLQMYQASEDEETQAELHLAICFIEEEKLMPKFEEHYAFFQSKLATTENIAAFMKFVRENLTRAEDPLA